MRRYPIDRVTLGVPPTDDSDFSGSFRVGYSAAEGALYVAALF